MRDSFVRSVLELAKNDRNVELITGDLGFGVLRPFWEAVPDQFLDAGIAEQNMTAMAAGMALEGKTVFTYSIGNFPTLRCIEQIRNDCAVNALHEQKPADVVDPYTPNGIENPVLPGEDADTKWNHTMGETYRPTWFQLQEVSK